MRDVLATAMFAPVAPLLAEHGERIKAAGLLHLSAPATVEGVLALGHLEAACLDLGLKYRRRFFTSRHHLPRDADAAWRVEETGLSIVLDVEEATRDIDNLTPSEHVHIVPLTTRVELGSAHRRFTGSLDAVAQSAALAAMLAQNGRRVRNLRPFLSLGLWLRAALDTNMDPIHTLLVNHLREEGTVRVVPLPEVHNPFTSSLDGLSTRQLKRLAKVWPTMDVEERSMALSELVLPCLTESELSTPRLEELVWHRMLVGDCEVDVVSQMESVRQAWPEDADDARLFASSVLDRWLKTGVLSPNA